MRNWWAHQDSNLEPKDYEAPRFLLVHQAVGCTIFPADAN